MKRAGILSLAIVLTLGLAVTASQAAKAKKVDSEVEVDGWKFPPPNFDFTLVGDVYSKKNKCEKGRAITVYAYDQPTDEPVEVGTATTDRTGDWELEPIDPGANNYHSASVARKKIGHGDKKLICKADESPLLLTD
jgi:hypothetical protein